MIFKAETARIMTDHFYSDEAQMKKVADLIKKQATEGGYRKTIWISSQKVLDELVANGYKLEKVEENAWAVIWGDNETQDS